MTPETAQIPIDLAQIQAAAARIRPYIRRTPNIAATLSKTPLLPEPAPLTLKLECLQMTGSFKARGAMSKRTALTDADAARGLVTASGGNHGLGVAYAAWQAGIAAHVYLPLNTPEAKVAEFDHWGAQVHRVGAVWDDANAEAIAAADAQGRTYIHPFADPQVIAGQGTVALEILEDCPTVDTLLVAIGGGGLISGIATAVKALRPEVKIIGVEPVGAPTLRQSIAAGTLVRLDRIETAANTLAPRQSHHLNFGIIRDNVTEIVLVSDADMRRAAQCLWQEFGVAAEMSGAATVAALQSGAYRPGPEEQVVALVCGAGQDGIVA